MNENFCVVLRSVGERTENASIKIVKNQVSDKDAFFLIKGKPFGEAHIESIQIALKSEAKWALFLDADVLLKDDAIETMLTIAKNAPIQFFQYNFRILDYEFEGESYGVHFYSTKFFNKALKYKEIALQSSRPEYQVCYEIAKNERLPSLSSDAVVALHGYEQYYADLYRTAFVRSVRYRRHLDFFLRSYSDGYLNNETTNFDKIFMFWGLIFGMIYGYDHYKAPLDKTFYEEQVNKIFTHFGIREKSDLHLNDDYVNTIFNFYTPSPLYLANRHWLCPQSGISINVPDNSIKGRFLRFSIPILVRIKRSIKTLLFG